MNYFKQAKINKNLLDKERPLTGQQLKEFKEYYSISLTYTSNALEGNTLTESETKVILEDGLTVSGKPLKDVYEATGHRDAYNYLFELAHDKTITIENIKHIHYLFYNKINSEYAGKYRTHNVIVTGTDYVFPKYADLEKKMNELQEWIDDSYGKLDPIRFAAMLHLKFVTIHPFIDGNGRTARLIMNFVLIQNGYDLAIIPPVCRYEYLDCIRIAQNKNDLEPFCKFIAERVVENQKDMMRMLHIPYPKSEIER